MKKPLVVGLLLAATSLTGALLPASASESAKTESTKLEHVVLMMRHSVRPPTKADVTPPGWAAQPWSKWSTPYGELTPHGMAGAKLMGEYDRAAYAGRGLFAASGCPQAGDVAVWASWKQRAIETAKNYVEGMFPKCDITVDHPTSEETDVVFHPSGPDLKIDGAKALAETEKRLPPGGLKAVHASHEADFKTLQRVLGTPDKCAAPNCQLIDLPSHLKAVPDDGVDLAGALGVASTAGVTVLLEYLEGKPMSEVGWGRATKEDLTSLLKFHPTKFYYESRTPYVAVRAAAPIARRILSALKNEDAKKLTLLVGHDTNIAHLSGMLDLHWQVAEYPADEPPPGGAVGFELLREPSGKHLVRAFYQAQSMDQLRNLTPLTAANAPARVYIPIPECTGTSNDACPLDRFEQIVQAKLKSAATP
ncbi:MAG: histidine-type phosphatase [Rhodospirillaceae bacterium]|nr:histidine-type phosphatase [Rhodospirillaceae bacterium]